MHKTKKRKKILEENPHCFFCRRDLTMGNSILQRYRIDGYHLDGKPEFIVICNSKVCKTQPGLMPSGKSRKVTGSRSRRHHLWREDPHCAYCRVELDFDDSTLDHKTPRSRGGSNKSDNLVLCCHFCNGAKGSKTVDEFRQEWYYLTLDAKV